LTSWAPRWMSWWAVSAPGPTSAASRCHSSPGIGAGETEDLPTLLAVESNATPKLSQGVYAYDATDATGTGPMEAMYTIGAGFQIPGSHSGGLRFHGAAKVLSAMRHHDQIERRRGRPACGAGGRSQLHAYRAALARAGVRPRARRQPLPSQMDNLGAVVLVCVSGHGLLDLSRVRRPARRCDRELAGRRRRLACGDGRASPGRIRFDGGEVNGRQDCRDPATRCGRRCSKGLPRRHLTASQTDWRPLSTGTVARARMLCWVPGRDSRPEAGRRRWRRRWTSGSPRRRNSRACG